MAGVCILAWEPETQIRNLAQEWVSGLLAP